ncbi:MAG TPA: glycosyltransferase family 9 protein [Burkholderiaceae bacterium]|jgi:ADP-heptose:LPS heptosyltransferase
MIDESFYPTLPDVKKITVLRPNAVGDFVFALPALHALRHAYPHAEIVYIGKQWHVDFLDGRPGPIDRVEVLPPCPGVGAATDAQIDERALQRFVDRMHDAAFDIAIQLYGGGRYSNPFIKRFDARLTIGLKSHDAPPLDRTINFDGWHNRRLQLLEVAALAGADTLRLQRELQVTDKDRRRATRAIPVDLQLPLVLIQPAASDRRRCWPPKNFAAVADALAHEGALVAINGTRPEMPIVQQVIEHMHYPAIALSGDLSLSGLCGLLERAALLVANDTGPLHLALAIGTPCVGIYWFTNFLESAPLRQHAHRAALSTRIDCPVCSMPNLTARCEHDVSFVADVGIEEVTEKAIELFRMR